MTMPDEPHALLRGAQPALRRFTVHLDFMAVDERQARGHAQAYAEGLNRLRPEVDTYTARVSMDGDWSRLAVVFCRTPGPDVTDVCTDSAGHSGWHHGPGASNRWSRDGVPRAPDRIEN